MTRLVVVLGYSEPGHEGLHPVCAARLRHAEAHTGATDRVLLSGWARHPGRESEAALMRGAWSGPTGQLVLDHDARTTVGNARAAAALARQSELDEVVIVTSRWHATRARVVFAFMLRGVGVRVRRVPAGTPVTARTVRREIVAWFLLVPQLVAELRPSRGTRPNESHGTRSQRDPHADGELGPSSPNARRRAIRS